MRKLFRTSSKIKIKRCKNFNSKHSSRSQSKHKSDMSPADIESLETAFSKLDLNGNGSLCQQEILDMIPPEDLSSLLNDMDNDGDGTIDYGEFLSGMQRNLTEPSGKRMLKEGSRQILIIRFDSPFSWCLGQCPEFWKPPSAYSTQEAFCVFGGDGIVTKNYLKLSMLNSGQTSSSEVQEMLDTLDTDNDGKVRLEDFMRIFVDKERSSFNRTRKQKCQIL